MLLLSLLLFGLSHVAAQDTPQEERARNWAAFSVGFPTIDVQIGFYDPFGIWANPRLVVGYLPAGAAFVNFDSIWFTRGRTGLYLGAGSGVLIGSDVALAGLHLTSGTDIAINDDSGILLDSAIGVYPLVLGDDNDDDGGFLFPFFGRVSVGYRVSF